MYRMKGYGIFAALIGGMLLFSCTEKSSTGNGDAFDRALLLEQVANKQILPAFSQFHAAVSELAVLAETFCNQPDANTLTAVQEKWKQAYLKFQGIRSFNFGAGEKPLIGDIAENLGTWPVDTAVIESRIVQADYVMTDFRRDSRGLYAMEYLLFSPDVLARFQGSGAIERIAMLRALSNDALNWSAEIDAAWKAQAPQFIAETSKSAGAPTSELYNYFLQSYELIKNYKIGLPAGFLVGQTQAEPEKVEAYYSGLSVIGIKSHLHNIEQTWYGNDQNGNPGIGFDDYLEIVEGGAALREATIEQWKAIHAVLDPIDDNTSFSDIILSNPALAESLFTETQKMTRFLKSDLSSLLGIAITYSSGDGD